MRRIDDAGGPFIIAEIGINHGGSVEIAELLIRCARRSGADAVKFQGFTPNVLEPPGRRRDFLKSVHLTSQRLARLRDYACRCGLGFGLSVFDPKWVYAADAISCDFIKIASGNLTNTDLVCEVAAQKKPVVISTGTHDEDEIGNVVDFLLPAVSHLTIMKCTSCYPTPVEECNVRGVLGLRAFEGGSKRTKIGYSCHSRSIYPAVAAAALGAQVIEKHIALETTGNNDLESSLTPERFAEMTIAVREAYFSLGSLSFKPIPVEKETIKVLQGRREWREKQKKLT